MTQINSQRSRSSSACSKLRPGSSSIRAVVPTAARGCRAASTFVASELRKYPMGSSVRRGGASEGPALMPLFCDVEPLFHEYAQGIRSVSTKRLSLHIAESPVEAESLGLADPCFQARQRDSIGLQ